MYLASHLLSQDTGRTYFPVQTQLEDMVQIPVPSLAK